MRARGRAGTGSSFLLSPLGIVFTTVADRPHRVRHRAADPPALGGALRRLARCRSACITASYAVMQLIFAPVWGRLSDRDGRRPVILVSLAGSAVASLLIGVAGTLLVLFVARVAPGHRRRLLRRRPGLRGRRHHAPRTAPGGWGMIGAAFGLGFVLGPGHRRALLGIDAAPALLRRRGAGGRQPADRLPAPARVAARPDSTRGAGAAGSPWCAGALSSRDLAPLVWLSFVATFAFVGMESTFALFGERRFDYDTVADGAAVHLHRRDGGALAGLPGGARGASAGARRG